MDAPPAATNRVAARSGGLRAEGQAALAYSADTLRAIRDRYRGQYAAQLARWQRLKDELEGPDRTRSAPATDASSQDGLEHELEGVATELGKQQAELDRLELAISNVEATWRFLQTGAEAGAGDDERSDGLPREATVRMRIVEAQEAERARLAQDVHDGPAQSLSNAIFQAEFVERVLPGDPALAATELAALRELLRRELGNVRSFISHLRPPVLDSLGLDVALRDAIEHWAVASGVAVADELDAPADRLTPAQQTVVLRIVQEALQNIRKHAAASAVAVLTRLDGGDWILEVRDDGRGFEPGSGTTTRRRHFGLQFMRERAALIGARLDVRSRPEGGTVVQLAIPMSSEESR